MNSVISYVYNFEHEEIVDYYISFMKSLAVRLDSETMKFFFNEVPPTANPG
ncbi:MAG: hypothetical protein P4M11_04375 [Candidatus Pacebacteria bacterium]|nr:hypothetical protein [Candidatus Paceibacterota bacterium]